MIVTKLTRRLLPLLIVLSALSSLGAAAAREAYKPDSLTIQPGETTGSVYITWYSPAAPARPMVRLGGELFPAEHSELTMPTELKADKYTDTGKHVNRARIDGLEPGTTYFYQTSDNGGLTWSETFFLTTPEDTSFVFAFTSDPQIKEDRSIDSKGWNPEDGTNQTGWAKMTEVLQASGVTLIVSAGDQVEDQSWGKTSEYEAFFAPEAMASIAYAPAVGNHDRHYMFADHFTLPNEMAAAEDGDEGTDETLEQVKTTFRGQNSGTSQSHGNYIAWMEGDKDSSNGVTVQDGIFDFAERREMETRGNYFYLCNNVLFVTLNTGAYPGGNDFENADDPKVPSAGKDNSEAEAIVENFRRTLQAAVEMYGGEYDWLIVTHHKSTQTVAKHTADSDIENYVDAGFEKLMDDFSVDFVLAGHDHVYSRSYVLKDGLRAEEAKDDYTDPAGTIYITGNCVSDMQYYTPFASVDKANNEDYPKLANGESGSQAYLRGNLPYGNQVWNQEYSPSYVLFTVEGLTVSAKAYNLDGDAVKPESKLIDSFSVTKTR